MGRYQTTAFGYATIMTKLQLVVDSNIKMKCKFQASVR
jgi:hypothetical protein